MMMCYTARGTRLKQRENETVRLKGESEAGGVHRLNVIFFGSRFYHRENKKDF